MLSGKGADTAKVHNACISHKIARAFLTVMIKHLTDMTIHMQGK